MIDRRENDRHVWTCWSLTAMTINKWWWPHSSRPRKTATAQEICKYQFSAKAIIRPAGANKQSQSTANHLLWEQQHVFFKKTRVYDWYPDQRSEIILAGNSNVERFEKSTLTVLMTRTCADTIEAFPSVMSLSLEWYDKCFERRYRYFFCFVFLYSMVVLS